MAAQSIAKTAWNAQVEFKGKTPFGQTWIADLYCTQDNSGPVVFEIQLTDQEYEEYERRSKKYELSSVRCCWFYKKSLGKKVDPRFNHQREDIPMFPFVIKNNNYLVKVYADVLGRRLRYVPLAQFVENALNRKLEWHGPTVGKQTVQIEVIDHHCWKHGHPMEIITGYYPKDGNRMVELSNIKDINKLTRIASQLARENQAKSINTAILGYRKSHGGKATYFAASCPVCEPDESLQGRWHVMDERTKISQHLTRTYASPIEVNVTLEELMASGNKGHWVLPEDKPSLRGRQSRPKQSNT